MTFYDTACDVLEQVELNVGLTEDMLLEALDVPRPVLCSAIWFLYRRRLVDRCRNYVVAVPRPRPELDGELAEAWAERGYRP